jgi:hypothetical protein
MSKKRALNFINNTTGNKLQQSKRDDVTTCITCFDQAALTLYCVSDKSQVTMWIIIV